MGVTVNLTRTGMGRLLAQMPDECDALVRRTALEVERDAKIAAPVDTGNLRNSIKMFDARIGDAHAQVVVGAEYGLFVERGTSRQRAQPYLEPAVDKQRGPFEAALEALVKRLGQ